MTESSPPTVQLPDYEDSETTRRVEDAADSRIPSTRVVAPYSQARLDPLVEVWAWLAEEFQDSGSVHAVTGLSQLAEVYALSGHLDAARDASMRAHDAAPERAGIARQYRQLSPASERASAAYYEAKHSSEHAAREHAFAHAWLSARVAGAPLPPALDGCALSEWLTTAANPEVRTQASDDVVLAADYVTRIQAGEWETTFPTAAVVASGIGREPALQGASLARLAEACEGHAELGAAVPWLRAWLSPDAREPAVPQPWQALRGGGDAALASWVRSSMAASFEPASPHTASSAAMSLAERVFADGDTLAKLRLGALVATNREEARAALEKHPELEAWSRVVIQTLADEQTELQRPHAERAAAVSTVRTHLSTQPGLQPLMPWFQAFEAPREAARARLATLPSWVVDGEQWQAQLASLAADEPGAEGVASRVVELLRTSTQYAPSPVERAALDYLQGSDELPHGSELADPLDSVAREWVDMERAGQWGLDAKRAWAGRALAHAPDSPWILRYRQALDEAEGQSLYARMVPGSAVETAEREERWSDAVRLVLDAIAVEPRHEAQAPLYRKLSALYTTLGDLEKARVCDLEAEKRASS